MISVHALDTVLQEEKLSFREPRLLYQTEACLMFASKGDNVFTILDSKHTCPFLYRHTVPLFSKAVRSTAILQKISSTQAVKVSFCKVFRNVRNWGELLPTTIHLLYLHYLGF